jgi:hypothetical protein
MWPVPYDTPSPPKDPVGVPHWQQQIAPHNNEKDSAPVCYTLTRLDSEP